jgi:hypothetical protein
VTTVLLILLPAVCALAVAAITVPLLGRKEPEVKKTKG